MRIRAFRANAFPGTAASTAAAGGRPRHTVWMSSRTDCMVSWSPSEVNDPPGELMYMVMSRSGSNDSRQQHQP